MSGGIRQCTGHKPGQRDEGGQTIGRSHGTWEAGDHEAPPGRRRGQGRGDHVPQGSPRGTYLEVSGALRERIRKGEITESLPSQAALMSEYSVSRSTIERALAALKAEGVIESVQGAG
ncbi:winged helix-turn-helix domain-containing protein, partial [Streptomyces sp. 2MCAF27]